MNVMDILQNKLNRACATETATYQTGESYRIQRAKLTAYVNGVLANVYPYEKNKFVWSLKQIRKLNKKIFKHKS